jgi:hypothetical protein
MGKRMQRIERIETDCTTREKIRFYPFNLFDPRSIHSTQNEMGKRMQRIKRIETDCPRASRHNQKASSGREIGHKHAVCIIK